MLSAVMLNVSMLKVVLLSFIALTVIMLSIIELMFARNQAFERSLNFNRDPAPTIWCYQSQV
jgi:hypothetical protein